MSVVGDTYIDEQVGDVIYRTFDENVSDIELVWHRDHEARTVTVIEGSGWKFQYDNQLPIELKEGDVFSIEAMRYHRILKGDTGLVLKIDEKV